MGEGCKESQNLKVEQANYLNGDEFENGLFSSFGDVSHPSMAKVTYPDEEVKESEPMIVHPLAVGEEQGVPNLVPSNWVIERVKFFCHVREDQMMAMFTEIKASRHQNNSASVLDLSFK